MEDHKAVHSLSGVALNPPCPILWSSSPAAQKRKLALAKWEPLARGLHSSSFQFNLSRF